MVRRINETLWQAWRDRLERHARDGLSVAEFCRREQVSVPSFYSWKRKLTRPGAAPTNEAAPPAFVPIRVEFNAVVELTLANGTLVRVSAHQPQAIEAAIGAAGRLPRANQVGAAEC